MWRKRQAQNPRRLALTVVAKETQATTPDIAAALPYLRPGESEKLVLDTLPALDPAKCPRFTLPREKGLQNEAMACGTTVRVCNIDSFDAAIDMPFSVLGIPVNPPKAARDFETDVCEKFKFLAAAPEHLDRSAAARVAVLNMASDKNPGGGWLSGSSAQEEALCFRSSLAASLHRRLYPIHRRAGLYTHDVVIFRESMNNGHKLMVPDTPVADLPVVSVLSVAGIRRPELMPAGRLGEQIAATSVPVDEQAPGNHSGSDHVQLGSQDDKGKRKGKGSSRPPGIPLVFADPAARELTKDKMRLCLRMAATKGHSMVVLGAIGCGAFRNPPREVAKCWMEVLSEIEFAGGWFREIWFAVYDRKREGNYEIFEEIFDGKVIGEQKVLSTDI